MRELVSQSALLCAVALVLVWVPACCVAYSSMGPYELMLIADKADHLVVGEVVRTERSDSIRGNSVSLVQIESVLFGPAFEGDTLLVHWRAAHPDWGSIVSEPGPQLSSAIGPHVWLLVEADGELYSGGDPIGLSEASRPNVIRYLAWARAPRRAYAGVISDPEKAREHGYDPQTGDVIRQVLAAYLGGYLRGSDVEK